MDVEKRLQLLSSKEIILGFSDYLSMQQIPARFVKGNIFRSKSMLFVAWIRTKQIKMSNVNSSTIKLKSLFSVGRKIINKLKS